MGFIFEKLFGPTLDREGEKISENLNSSPTKTLHSKVLRIFKAHGIKDTQIPLIVPAKYGISLNDIEDRKSFQAKMSGEFLTWLVETFYINPDWLHDDNARIYRELFVYKSAIRNYVDLLLLNNKETILRNLIVIKPKGKLKDNSMVKVLLEEVCKDKGLEFSRHIVFQDLWHWHEGPGDQLRLMTRMFLSMDGLGYIFGNSALSLELEDFDAGNKFYSEMKLSRQDWHPDGYAVCSNEKSALAKDTENMPLIIKWGKQKGLTQYFEEKTGIKIDANPLKFRNLGNGGCEKSS